MLGCIYKFKGIASRVSFICPGTMSELSHFRRFRRPLVCSPQWNARSRPVSRKRKPLHLAIGVDIGETLVSRLGVRRHRDAICQGQAVECAAELEEACGAGQIGISRRVRQALPKEIRRCFPEQKDGQRFVATAATFVPQQPVRS